MNETHEEKLRQCLKNYDSLSENMKEWLEVVGRRLCWDTNDLKLFFRMSTSKKDMTYFKSLNLKENMSYYVVSPQREALEKFRVFYLVYGPKVREDYIAFTGKVFLSSYLKQVEDPNYRIDELLMAQRRLLVYCHKNNNYVSDKQAAWIQGNLFSSDICDRVIQGNKVLILSEYEVQEIESLVNTIKLTKVSLVESNLDFNGLYKAEQVKKRESCPADEEG